MKSRTLAACRLVIAIALAGVFLPLLPLHAAESDRLAKLSFLLGTWTTDGVAGSTSFERALGNRMIIRRSWASIPASGGQPASKHEDLLIIFPYGETLRAAYYDSNGYVVGYELQMKGKNSVVLTSDTIAGVPRSRLSYKLGSDGVLAANFEMAPAATPAAFAPSMAWNSRKSAK